MLALQSNAVQYRCFTNLKRSNCFFSRKLSSYSILPLHDRLGQNRLLCQKLVVFSKILHPPPLGYWMVAPLYRFKPVTFIWMIDRWPALVDVLFHFSQGISAFRLILYTCLILKRLIYHILIEHNHIYPPWYINPEKYRHQNVLKHLPIDPIRQGTESSFNEEHKNCSDQWDGHCWSWCRPYHTVLSYCIFVMWYVVFLPHLEFKLIDTMIIF